jgi:hypothetical protein
MGSAGRQGCRRVRRDGGFVGHGANLTGAERFASRQRKGRAPSAHGGGEVASGLDGA